MKLNILGDEEIEAIIDKAIVDYEDVEMTDQEWEDKQLELVAKAQAKMTAKQIIGEVTKMRAENPFSGESSKMGVGWYKACDKIIAELEEAIK